MSSTNPVILSGDSLLFESSDLFATYRHPSDAMIVGDDVDHDTATSSTAAAAASLPHGKQATITELDSRLPVCHDGTTGDEAPTGFKQPAASPFNIHSDVLDSVFSTTLEGNEHLQDQTPMFDELDFIIDGSKVNSKDDWVSLFGDHTATNPANNDLVVKDEELDEVLLSEPREPHYAASGSPSESSSAQSSLDSTPLLDNYSTSTRSSVFANSRVSKPKKKTDHLGVTAFSRKQRSQEMSPIPIDTSDPVAFKRAKNTEAARRSRARKMERMSQLEQKVEELLSDKAGLEMEVVRLRELLSMNGIEH